MEKLISSLNHLSRFEVIGIFAFVVLLLAFLYAIIRMAMIKSLETSYKAPVNKFKSDLKEEETQEIIDKIKKDAVPGFLIVLSAAIIYFYWGTGF